MEGTKATKLNKKIIVGVIALVVAIAVIFGVYKIYAPKATSGSKAITISVVDNNGDTTEYETKTDAEFLKQAMEETDGLTFSGEDSDYGLMVDTVNDITAVYDTDGAYWSFYVNDELCNYGVEEQPVNDGDDFKIEYTPAQ